MKLFKCDTKGMTFELVDLPRHNWRVLPPKKMTVALTLAGIVITAVLWAIT